MGSFEEGKISYPKKVQNFFQEGMDLSKSSRGSTIMPMSWICLQVTM